jgi:hypothetical protein
MFFPCAASAFSALCFVPLVPGSAFFNLFGIKRPSVYVDVKVKIEELAAKRKVHHFFIYAFALS